MAEILRSPSTRAIVFPRTCNPADIVHIGGVAVPS